jgi:hypothetical protein
MNNPTIAAIISNLKEWQTLIGAGVAILAATIAWLNFRRQLFEQRRTLRINLVSREEERIERAMPGLRAANMLLVNLVAYIGADVSAHNILSIYEKYGMKQLGDIRGASETALATCEPVLRDRVESQITGLFLAAEHFLKTEVEGPMQQAEAESPTSDTAKRLLNDVSWQIAKKDLAEQHKGLIALQVEIEQHIERFQEMQPRFRKAVEEYFNE